MEVCFAVPHPRVTSYIVTTLRSALFVICFAIHIPLEQMCVMARCWFELVCQLESEPLCAACRRTYVGTVTLLLVDITGAGTACLFVCQYHSIQ
jgi:hypothetical protein